jgi:tetratricopeptide (TPR) repeat protein
VILERSFLEAARTIGDPQAILPALITAAMIRAARRDLEGAMALVQEFDEYGSNSLEQWALVLPDALRLCKTAEANDRAASLLKNAESNIRHLQQYFLSAQAIFAEMEERIEHALALYLEAANRWKNYGCVLEEGYALLGAGRCLQQLSRIDEAVTRLHEARAIFTKLDARALIDEVDGHLGQATAISS